MAGLFSGFMVDTWFEASVVAVVAGTVGFFVMLRGATFAAHAIPQGAFTGAAGAALVGANSLVGVGTFSLLGVVAIARWGRRGRHDVVIALCLVTLLGVGSLFLSMSSQYAEQTFSLLFGEPLAVSSGDLVPTVLLGAVCIAVVVVLYRRLVLSSLAPELAAVQGIRPERVELWFLLSVGAATTLALPIVGALLVFSLMIGPPAAARFLTNRPAGAIAASGALALATVWASIVASFFSNWPIGFFVGSFAVVWYVFGRELVTWRQRRLRNGQRGMARRSGPSAVGLAR
jgi:zinc/manganese transport system permease protein